MRQNGLLGEARGRLFPGESPIPPECAINEAIETAKRFCGAGAPAFVNGVLGAALRERVSKT